jgi:hypothetical protein
MLERFRRRRRSIDGSYERRLEQLENRVLDIDAQLRRQLAPGEMARALSEDARKRGLE